MAGRRATRLVAQWALLAAGATAAAATPRFGDVVRLSGNQLPAVAGSPIAQLALYACHASACAPIPFQVDERDATNNWVLDQGPEANANRDDPPETLDDNDVLLFMAADAGDQASRTSLPAGHRGAAIGVYDPLTGTSRWVYLLVFASAAPRSTRSYVHYDAATDRVRGARVILGFDGGIPDYLALTHPDDTTELNLLDRLKVRATATFFFGLIHFSRSEGDLRTEFAAWRAGPIRVIRSQRQWIRLGWGIRSPTFGSYTYFYRDGAELPVSLYLNHPPTYFFHDVILRAILDFRDLPGWSLLIPSIPTQFSADGISRTQQAAIDAVSDSWFALIGPEVTLINALAVSPSLDSARRRLLCREGSSPQPPEAVPGESPGIGYQIDHWEHVGAGSHQLTSVSYALPPDVDPRAFMATQAVPLRVAVGPLP